MARKLVVEIVGDASSLEKSFKRAERSTAQFNRNIEKTGRGVKGFGMAAAFTNTRLIGAAGLVVGLKESVEAASNLNEMISKTDAVFGDSARGVKAWSGTLTNSFGLSRREALATASTFGALFAPIGIVGEQSAQLSERLTELGGDLASFYDTDVASALEAVRSGLVGEAEPLRNYGVRLSETRVQQEALVETGKKNVKQLTDEEKTLARVNIILRDSKKAHGDFARTQHGLAGESKTLKANLDDLKTALGDVATPPATEGTSLLNRFADAVRALPGPVKDAAKNSLFFAGTFAKAVGIIKDAQQKLEGPPVGVGGPIGKPRDFPAGPIGVPIQPPAEIKRTAEQRNQWWDAMIGRKIDRVQDVQSLQGQLASLRTIAALIKQRLAITKDITRQLTLGDLLLSVQRQQIGVREQQQAIREQMAEQAAAAAQAARDEALAWADFAVEKAAATKGLKDDLKAAHDRLKLLEKQAGVGKKTAAEATAIWEQQQKINQIRKDMNKAEKGFATRFKPMNVSAFIQSLGLGLSVQQMRKLAVALAQLGPGGTLPAGRAAAFAGAGGVTVNGDVHVHGVQDTKQMEGELHKRARRRAAGRRGN